MAIALSDELAARMLAAIRWVEQQPDGPRRPRQGIDRADPFERAKLTSQLSRSGSATATVMKGNAEDGWTNTTNAITVHEDTMLESGETIASGREIHVKWFHGRWVLDDVVCSQID